MPFRRGYHRITVGMRSKIPSPKGPKTPRPGGRPKASSQEKFNKFLKEIPGIISGKIKRSTTPRRRIYNSFWAAVTLSIFTDVYDAYEVKSLGLPDELGKDWPDLAPVTKAYKRPKRGLLTPNQRRKYRSNAPGLLTPNQYQRWKLKFARVAQAQEGRARKEGKPIRKEKIRENAAKAAWADAKRRGAETLIGTLGQKDMLIMRVTDTLFNSLKPGRISGGKYLPGDTNQVVRLKGGNLTIGTKVKYASMAAREVLYKAGGGQVGSSNREFLPDDLGIWYERAVVAGRNAIAKELNSLSHEKKLWK